MKGCDKKNAPYCEKIFLEKILKKIHYSIKNTISNTNKAFCKINLSQVKLKKFQKLNGQYFDIAFSHHQTKQSYLTHLKYFCVKHT